LLEIYSGALDVESILSRWYRLSLRDNCGAFVPFVGSVRDENGISGLSFDLYEPLLKSWFARCSDRVEKEGATLCMAHSNGNVYLQESSFVCAIYSSKRKIALSMIAEFVEDFKTDAPIWKYDLIGKRRIYALERSTPLYGSGILS